MAYICLDHIEKSYIVDGKIMSVLKDICLDLPNQGLVCLLGPSGSGKSTILQMIAGITLPTSGHIFDDGIKRDNKKGQTFIARYGLLFQQCHLLENQSPLANVMLPIRLRGYTKRKAKKEAIQLFKEYQLTHLLKRNCKSLSGGEKQRIAFLRMLAQNTSVYLADEPTGALDEDMGNVIMTHLSKISKDRLVLVVTHNQALVDRYADRVIHLFDGRIVLDKTVTNINKEINQTKRKKIVFNDSLTLDLAMHDLKHHMKRHVLGLIASFISLFCLMIGGNFYQTTTAFVQHFTPLVKDYLFVEVSKKTSYDLEGSPLSLTRVERPTEHEMMGLMTYFPKSAYSVDIRPLLNQGVTLHYQDEVLQPPFISIYEDSNEEIIPTLWMNSLAKTYFDANLIGQTVMLKWQFVIEIDDTPITHDLAESFIVQIDENETTFMNEPRLYLPYQFMLERFKEVWLTDTQNLLDYLAILSHRHALTNYAYLLCLSSVEYYETIDRLGVAKQAGTSFAFNNQQLLIHQALVGTFSGLHLVMAIFLLIALIGTGALIGILTYTNIQFRRKEMAIMTIIGFQKSKILSMFLIENGTTMILSAITAFSSYFAFHPLLQIIFKKWFSLPSFQLNFFDASLMFWMGGLSLLFSFGMTWIVWTSIGNIELEKELKER